MPSQPVTDEKMIGDLYRKLARTAALAKRYVELGPEDVARAREFWLKLGDAEKSRIIWRAAGLMKGEGVEMDEEEVARYLERLLDMMFREGPGPKLTYTLFQASCESVGMGIDTGLLVLVMVTLMGALIRLAPDWETAESVAKIFMWSLALFAENFTYMKEAVFTRATGAAPTLFRNLLRAYASDVGREFAEKFYRIISGDGHVEWK